MVRYGLFSIIDGHFLQTGLLSIKETKERKLSYVNHKTIAMICYKVEGKKKTYVHELDSQFYIFLATSKPTVKRNIVQVQLNKL